MTRDDFIKQFRPQVWEIAMESFYEARLNSGTEAGVLKARLSEVMIQQMKTSTEMLGKMYDAMHQKETKDVPPGKTK